MCQLLGMNSAAPSDFCSSFSEFARRGGDTDLHVDGWGLAFYEEQGLRIFLDSLPAARSPKAKMLQNYPVKTRNMISHIRYATSGVVSLENVHPFTRKMWGIQWCFAHNGDIPKFKTDSCHEMFTKGKTKYNPIGETDSEAVFCAILNYLHEEFSVLPSIPILYATLYQLCMEIVRDDPGTIFNFLLGCDQYTLFAFSWPGSRPGSDVWNGLFYTLRNECLDFKDKSSIVDNDVKRVAIITTKPLTINEPWIEMKKGELILFDRGLPYSLSSTCGVLERPMCSLENRVKLMMTKDHDKYVPPHISKLMQ